MAAVVLPEEQLHTYKVGSEFINYKKIIHLQHVHQSEQAAKGTCMRTNNTPGLSHEEDHIDVKDKNKNVQMKLLKQFHAIIRQDEEQLVSFAGLVQFKILDILQA